MKKIFVRDNTGKWIQLKHKIIRYKDLIIDPIDGEVYRDWEIHNAKIKLLGYSPLETMSFECYVDEIIKDIFE